MTLGAEGSSGNGGSRLSRTNNNLWTAFIGHARTKRLYTAYASKAIQDGHPDVAETFLRVARSPDVYPFNTLSAVDELRTTQENLQTVVRNHAYDTQTLYPRMVTEAEQEGRDDAAALIREALSREQRELEVLKEAQHSKGWDGVAGAPETPSTGPAVGVAPSMPAAGFVDTEMERAREGVSRERERVAAVSRIREVIFGMQDGLISTAILVSSVYGATQDNYVTVVAGLAGGLGGVVSMAAGSYLSSHTEREVKEAEISKASGDFHANRSDSLARLEVLLRTEGLSEEAAVLIAETMGQSETSLLRTMIEKELGLSADVDTVPWKDAAAMGLSFFVGAAIPIIPYILIQNPIVVMVALVATGMGLFGMGAGKTRFTGRNPFRSGIQILGIGVAAAVIGYALGSIVPRVFGV